MSFGFGIESPSQHPHSGGSASPEISKEQKEAVHEHAVAAEHRGASVEVEDLEEEDQLAVIDEVMGNFSEALRGIDDYNVFASTAKFLHGEEISPDELNRLFGEGHLNRPPGDVDIFAYNMEAMDRIRERIKNIPGVHFDNEGGEYGRYPGEDVRVLSGSIVREFELKNGTKRTLVYPFEVFEGSRFADEHQWDMKSRDTTKLRGLNVLSLEGLQRQYAKNLEFESRVKKSFEKVETFLVDNQEKIRPDLDRWQALSQEGREEEFVPSEGSLLKATADKLELSYEQLVDFYILEDDEKQLEADGEKGEEDAALAREKAQSTKSQQVFGWQKFKTINRAENIGELSELLKIDIPTKSKPEEPMDVELDVPVRGEPGELTETEYKKAA